MPTLDAHRVYHILQNLMNLEISYLEYSQQPRDFSEYQTYADYFDNYVLRSKDLYRFYYPIAFGTQKLPKYISEIGDVTDVLNILPGYDLSVSKLFNFPGSLRHKCNYYSLIYQIEGTSTLTLDSGQHGLCAGDFFLIPPDEYYSIETTLEGLSICLNLRSSFVAAEYRSLALGDPQLTSFFADSMAADHPVQFAAMHTGENETVRNLALSIYAEHVNQDEYSNVSMRSYLALLFAAILRSPGTRLESSAKVSRLDEQFHRIETYLKKNYQTANLTELADTIHFSKQHICHIVKEKTGCTFNTLLIRTRLNIAAQYLLDSKLPLEEIAWLCGFSTSSHMIRTFKTEYGMTPSAYRNEKKGSHA